MKDVCFPLAINSELCKRVALADQLKKIVKEVECCDEKTPPPCRVCKDKEEQKSEDPKCYCSCAPGFHHHVMMDGQLAKSQVSEADNAFKPAGRKWCPPCMYITPLMDPIHSCYRADATRSKETQDLVKRNGIPPKEMSSAHSCRGIIPRNRVEGMHRTIPKQIGAEAIPQGENAVMDDVFGGQKCPYMHPTPTRKEYFCPEGDPCHIHWSPPRTQQCRYPNTCVASCFQHPAVNDWIYKNPTYRSYLQNINDKPFKKGF